MKEGQRLGLLASVVQMLNEAGSWTGRMHIHKLLYFAQELLGLDPEYEFVLYQRGPYSFDLDADIRSLRSIGAVDITPKPPYGPSYGVTGLGKVLGKASPVREQMSTKLRELASELGPKQARDLELLATTFYVLNKETLESDKATVQRVLSLKPQFSEDEAENALQQVKQIQERFR
jgi:uncharacterized protein YwgA